jgi:hypothetical protein
MLTLCLLYLLAHLLMYALVLRRSARFRSEKSIFLFHLVSALFMTVVATGYALFEPGPALFGLPGVVLVLSVHGIYSLSFLELWSLAQGGYSLSILATIKQAQESCTEPDFAKLERIGKTKLQNRIDGLGKLRLITVRDTEVTLTSRGRIVAEALAALLTWIGAQRVAARS